MDGPGGVDKGKPGAWQYQEARRLEYEGTKDFVEGLSNALKKETGCYDAVSKFSEGLAFVKRNGKYGYININGEEVIPCQYDVASSFSEGLAFVKRNRKYGYINTEGKEVIPCQYDKATTFFENHAVVSKNSKYHFINKSGQEVLYDEKEKTIYLDDIRNLPKHIFKIKEVNFATALETDDKCVFVESENLAEHKAKVAKVEEILEKEEEIKLIENIATMKNKNKIYVKR